MAFLIPHSRREPIDQYYELGAELGRGNFSIVYLGTRKEDEERVAIKVLTKGDEDVKMEVKILETIRHPNVTNLHEVFESPTQLFIVLDLVTGGELFDKIVELNNYTEEDARKLTKNLLSVISYLHQKGVMHRDLKPENLLLETKDGPITNIKVTDFGLAILAADKQTRDRIVGTPGYIAPEAIHLKEYTPKVDTWSIGVILYILLCGYPPYEDDDLTFGYHFYSPEWDKISPDAKDLISKLLTIDYEKRPSAEEALNHRWLKSPSIATESLSTTQAALRRFQARKKLKASILAVAGIARMTRLMGGLGKTKELSPLDESRQYLLSLDKVLTGNWELLQSTTEKAPESFANVDPTDKESMETLESIFRHVSLISSELDSLKRSYLKVALKGKDLSDSLI